MTVTAFREEWRNTAVHGVLVPAGVDHERRGVCQAVRVLSGERARQRREQQSGEETSHESREVRNIPWRAPNSKRRYTIRSSRARRRKCGC